MSDWVLTEVGPVRLATLLSFESEWPSAVVTRIPRRLLLNGGNESLPITFTQHTQRGENDENRLKIYTREGFTLTLRSGQKLPVFVDPTNDVQEVMQLPRMLEAGSLLENYSHKLLVYQAPSDTAFVGYIHPEFVSTKILSSQAGYTLGLISSLSLLPCSSETGGEVLWPASHCEDEWVKATYEAMRSYHQREGRPGRATILNYLVSPLDESRLIHAANSTLQAGFCAALCDTLLSCTAPERSMMQIVKSDLALLRRLQLSLLHVAGVMTAISKNNNLGGFELRIRPEHADRLLRCIPLRNAATRSKIERLIEFRRSSENDRVFDPSPEQDSLLFRATVCKVVRIPASSHYTDVIQRRRRLATRFYTQSGVLVSN
jgi:hypothetical protein